MPVEKESAAFDGTDVKITTWPPLAQVTTIARDHNGVQFTVLIETASPSLIENQADSEEPQVCLWHNSHGDHDWSELPLKLSKDHDRVLLLNRPQDRNVSSIWFTAELPGLPKHAQVVSFTVKFRTSGDAGWKWVKDTAGLADGELHYQQRDYQKHTSYDLKHWFDGISSNVKIDVERSETENTFLYSLTCPIKAAEGADSGYQHHQLGIPTHLSRWFSLVRLWSPWLAPRQGAAKFKLDKDGILLSFLRTDGSHVVVLGISGIDDVVTTFINDEQGNVIIKGRNDRTSAGTSRVLVAVAESFEVANAAVMYHARRVVGAYSTADTSEIAKMTDDVKPEWLQEWYDGLTYCTWNALGQNLTAQKIYDALDDLKKENINVTNLIVDDNWQSLAQGETQFVKGWSSFEANPAGFPDGMKATTTEIRKRHPNVNHIAVWHAILGYWGGVDPNGEIAKKYKTIQVEKEPGVAGGTFTVVAAEDAKRMYQDFYSFLSDAGIDSVKTDAQFFLDLLVHAPDRRALITEYQDAWTLGHLRHFSSRAISCMSQTPQLLFHSQLPCNKPRLLVRNSDDFFPDVDASHPWHIFCNAHNALLTQHLNVLPDWDMFQTSHPWASFHAAARCVSGGPIYFTDTPGQHDLPLLRQITAQTSTGKTVILRPHTVGKALDPYNAYTSHSLLKIGTYVGYARTGTSIMGVFNVTSNSTLSELIPLSAFPGTESGSYIVGSFTSRNFSHPMSRDQSPTTAPAALVGLSLSPRTWEILTAYPLRTLDIHTTSVSIALLGLLDKMAGPAAVSGYDIYTEDNGRARMWIQLKALGTVGIWISDLPKRSLEGEFMVLYAGKPVPVECVRKSATWGDGNVLEVDVERIWKEMGSGQGWGDEVSFEVFIG